MAINIKNNFGPVIHNEAGATINVNTAEAVERYDKAVKDGLLVDMDTQTEPSSDSLQDNSPFNPRLFNTSAKVELLRDYIGARIKGAILTHPEKYEAERAQIDPEKQNEWYYIWKMLRESQLLKRNPTGRDFIRRMIEWYPEVFETMSDEEQEQVLILRIEKSISAEKKLWSNAEGEIPFKDMNYAWKDQNIDFKKFQPLFRVCRDLRDAFIKLKTAIE